jgi:hypothetical protein
MWMPIMTTGVQGSFDWVTIIKFVASPKNRITRFGTVFRKLASVPEETKKESESEDSFERKNQKS